MATLARLGAAADLDAIEEAELRQLAKELSGVGLNPIKATLKAALQKQAAQDAKWVREHHAAQRQDPRPQLQAPLPDAEFRAGDENDQRGPWCRGRQTAAITRHRA